MSLMGSVAAVVEGALATRLFKATDGRACLAVALQQAAFELIERFRSKHTDAVFAEDRLMLVYFGGTAPELLIKPTIELFGALH